MAKIKFGCAELHYAFENEDGTYQKPVRIFNVLNLTADPDGNSEAWYGDDAKQGELVTNNGYTGSVEAQMFPDEFLCEALGWYKDEDGKIVEVADGKTKNFALMYRIQTDAKNIRHVLYKCTLSRPSKSAQGVTDSKAPQSDTLNISILPKYFEDIDKTVVSSKCHEGDKDYDTFYDAVVLPKPEATTAPASYTFGDTEE